jgi:hypothetical protein
MEMGGKKSLPEGRITVFRQFSNVNWSYRKENPDEYARLGAGDRITGFHLKCSLFQDNP